MPSDKQAYEAAAVPLRTFLLGAAGALGIVLTGLAIVFGLYTLWVNGPQAAVKPATLANPTAPVLETGLFRPRPAPPGSADPRAAASKGYRWRDGAHAHVEIPIDRAMAMTAARGAKAFEPVDGSGGASEDGR